jgi:hypothetical protein
MDDSRQAMAGCCQQITCSLLKQKSRDGGILRYSTERFCVAQKYVMNKNAYP